MSDLPIQPDEEAVTVSDIPEHMLSGFESDLFHTIDWEIISYDYSSESKDMAYFELFVEGKKVVGLNKDNYGDSWGLKNKDGNWFYQVIIGDDVHREYRYGLDELMHDVLYQLEDYDKFKQISGNYDEFTAWDLHELNEKFMDIQEELEMKGANIRIHNCISEEKVQELSCLINQERKRLTEIEQNLNQLEEIKTKIEN